MSALEPSDRLEWLNELMEQSRVRVQARHRHRTDARRRAEEADRRLDAALAREAADPHGRGVAGAAEEALLEAAEAWKRVYE